MFDESLALLREAPAIYAAAAGVLGLVVGSFINVVAHRLPVVMRRDWERQCAELQEQPAPDQGERFDLAHPRSRCPHCGHGIRWYENVPVLSWLLLRGRCSACSERISIRYPVVELLTGLATATVAYRYGLGVASLAAMLATWYLLAMSLIDLDTQFLYDELTLPLLWLGLVLSIWEVFVTPVAAIAGAALGYLSLWSIYHLFRWLTGKEGMGYGDFKLLAALGAFTGPTMLLPIVIISTMVGASVGIAMMVSGRLARGVPMSFGPYLATAGWIVLLWGQPIVDGYLDYIS